MNEKYKKYLEKFISILATAIVSALIATLQSMLTDMSNTAVASANPETAAVIGGALRAAIESTKRIV